MKTIKIEELLGKQETKENISKKVRKHKSPREHIRKGHYRHYKNGNVVWIAEQIIKPKNNKLEQEKKMKKDNVKYFAGKIVEIKRDIRKKLKEAGYKQIAINIFMDKFSNVIIIKSYVEDTNPNEYKFLCLNPKIHNLIKDKQITVLLFKREENTSIFHTCRQIKIHSLTSTISFKNDKYKFRRFIINNLSKEENINNEIYERFDMAS